MLSTRQLFERPVDRMASPSTEMQDNETTSLPPLKRRKVRKGTHSCWACKRRKEKCLFESSSQPDSKPEVCIGCERRNTRCVSQEFPEPPSTSPKNSRGMPKAAIETRWHAHSRSDQRSDSTSPWRRAESLTVDIPTPSSIRSSHALSMEPSARISPPEHQVHFLEGEPTRGFERSNNTAVSIISELDTSKLSGTSRYSRLSKALYNSLPSSQDLEIIARPGVVVKDCFNEFLTLPYPTAEGNTQREHDLTKLPSPGAHPVLIARHLLYIVNLLQQCFSGPYADDAKFSQPVETMIERMSDAATTLVTSQDKLLGNLEGVECVMLESMYHANCGNPRLSWLANRRAMLLAQLLKIHLPDHASQCVALDRRASADPALMWLRLVYLDRHMCLTLGLPPGSNDCSMASDDLLATDSEIGQIERLHCVVSAGILQRNESEAMMSDYDVMLDLDKQMQKLARRVPSRWWLPPSFSDTHGSGKATFGSLRRIMVQMFHYNILCQLHLPYMLSQAKEHKHEYSKIVRMSAAREMLTRFIHFTNVKASLPACRTSHFIGLMAATTLLLGLLDGHRSQSADTMDHGHQFLGHQYPHDRSLIEQAAEMFKHVGEMAEDSFVFRSYDLLRQLMLIESEAADGHTARADLVTVEMHGRTTAGQIPREHVGDALRYDIPYFGIIQIAQHSDDKLTAPISSEVPLLSPNPPDAREEIQNEPEGADDGHAMLGRSNSEHLPYISVADTSYADNNGNVFSEPMSQAPNGFFGALLPVPISGMGDWAFQGIDLEAFYSLP